MTDHRYSYLVFGIGLGAAAALMLAPQSGTKIRGSLMKKAQRTRDLIHVQTAELCDDVAQKLQRGKQAFQCTAEGVAEAFQAGKETLTR
jgi:gas vesicle protein